MVDERGAIVHASHQTTPSPRATLHLRQVKGMRTPVVQGGHDIHADLGLVVQERPWGPRTHPRFQGIPGMPQGT